MTSMALELERPRASATGTRPPPPRRDAPSGPPLIAPGLPSPGGWTSGRPAPPGVPVAAPASPTRSPRRRFVPAMVVVATATLAGGGVYLALSGDDDEDLSPGTDPASTSVPATFAVDLSTGD